MTISFFVYIIALKIIFFICTVEISGESELQQQLYVELHNNITLQCGSYQSAQWYFAFLQSEPIGHGNLYQITDAQLENDGTYYCYEYSEVNKTGFIIIINLRVLGIIVLV